MARSAAAVVMGFEHFDRQLNFAGVIFNNLGSSRHLDYLRDAIQEHTEISCLGGITRNDKIKMPERHLGLVTHEDNPLPTEMVAGLADIVEKSIDLDLLLNTLPDLDLPRQTGANIFAPKGKVRIAVARDRAFCFYYQDNIDLLERYGAEIVNFSPLTDSDLPPDIGGLYLGGGYPELYAEQLSHNNGLRDRIEQASRSGMPIYGECGGFMYLCEDLIDQAGTSFPMTGCFPFASKMFPKLKALGYREITPVRDIVIGRRGLPIRGHEFHYSELVRLDPGIQSVYRISDRSGVDKPPDGYQVDRTLGSYNHLHFGSQPAAAECFVDTCREYRHSGS